jgi:hypothetical protein
LRNRSTAEASRYLAVMLVVVFRRMRAPSLTGAAMGPASWPWPWTWDPGLAHGLKLGRRLLRLRDCLVPLLRLGQVNDRGVPGLVVPLGGAWVGVPHGVLEIAE